jgi:hypothetical protein
MVPMLPHHRVRCPTCAYLLAGLPSPICPECGQAITPFTPKEWSRCGARWLICAAGAISLHAGLLLSADVTAAGEPFASMPHYLWSVLEFAIIAALVLSVILVPAAIAIGRTIATTRARARAMRSTALYAAWTLLPTAAVAMAHATVLSRSRSLLLTPNPRWVDSPLVDLGNVSILPALLLLAAPAVIWCWALRDSTAMSAHPLDGSRMP